MQRLYILTKHCKESETLYLDASPVLFLLFGFFSSSSSVYVSYAGLLLNKNFHFHSKKKKPVFGNKLIKQVKQELVTANLPTEAMI